jgi:hypothetical protein
VVKGVPFWSAFAHVTFLNLVSLTLTLMIGALYLRRVAAP